jgi:hypothetical protein
MSVLKPRNRLINFRLTEEEFEYLHRACHDQGARSISDFARSAVMNQAGGAGGAGEVRPEWSRLEQLLSQMDGKLSQLIESLRPGPAPGV